MLFQCTPPDSPGITWGKTELSSHDNLVFRPKFEPDTSRIPIRSITAAPITMFIETSVASLETDVTKSHSEKLVAENVAQDISCMVFFSSEPG
jgi:hypothetical protein